MGFIFLANETFCYGSFMNLQNDLYMLQAQWNSITCIKSGSALCWDMGWWLAQHGDRSWYQIRWEGWVNADDSNFCQLICHWLSEIQVFGQHYSQLFFKVVQFWLKSYNFFRWKSSAFHKVVRWHFQVWWTSVKELMSNVLRIVCTKNY